MKPGLIALSLLVLLFASATPTAAFEFADGDRVVFLGSALVERDAADGYLETWLTARSPQANLVFRNLGWSGDTVWAEARAGFDTAQEGFQRLQQQIVGLQPTCIVVAYGANEAFDGAAGLPRFVQGLNRLLDMLEETKARLVLCTPPRQEQLPAPLPDPAAHNRDLELYADAIRIVAAERNATLVDLFARFQPVVPDTRLTQNGLHLSPYGYWCYALAMNAGLGLPRGSWRVELGAGAPTSTFTGTRLTEVELQSDRVAFVTLDETLPAPLSPVDSASSPTANSPRPAWPGAERLLRVTGLVDGRYTLQIDGQPAATGTNADWATGIQLTAGPEYEQLERLRAVIRDKNQLYFYRWRPQNDTYLLGFRKYEQGQNAREIPKFDPLIAAHEASIAGLRRPVPHRYLLFRTVKPAVAASANP